MNQLGYYGKTPHRGDFVRFNLPQAFIKVWDDWLQQLMLQGREQEPEWSTCYAQAPTYRFVLSGGIAGNTPWIGLMRPSHDKVGRLFPFCLAMSLADNALPCVSVQTHANWFVAAEALLDRVMNSDYQFEDLQEELANLSDHASLPQLGTEDPVTLSGKQTGDLVTISTLNPDALMNAQTLSALLDTTLRQTLGEYSLWITRDEAGATIVNAGLPIDSAGLAIFTKDWNKASSASIDAAALLACLSATDLPGIQDATFSTPTTGESQAEKPASRSSDAGHADTAQGSQDSTDTDSHHSRGSPGVEQVPSADDWAALEDFDDTPGQNAVVVPEVEPLELDEDDLPEAPWES
ncbi:MAG: type VI secretion system-associated protein TagF [Granulosicoccus sp.]|nr:type VI secretion system-associated protein TagF [Granulosicoccus sp.]